MNVFLEFEFYAPVFNNVEDIYTHAHHDPRIVYVRALPSRNTAASGLGTGEVCLRVLLCSHHSATVLSLEV